MLVLKRKVGESVTIDQEITVTVLAVEGERIKLGFQASPDVPIVRTELLVHVEHGARKDGDLSNPVAPREH